MSKDCDQLSPKSLSSKQGKNKEIQPEQDDSSCLIPILGRELSITCILSWPRFYYGVVASLNKSFQSLIRSGELYRLRRKAGIIEHWIFLSCHLLKWLAYDPINNLWIKFPNMVPGPYFMYYEKESLSVGTKLFVFGREVCSYAIYTYSVLNNTWEVGVPMNVPRYLFGSASLGEIGIVAGGCGENGEVLKSAELYNLESNTWVVIPSMNIARKMGSGLFMDGNFYIIGGIGVDGTMVTSVEMYDLKTCTWHVIPNMFPPMDDVEFGLSGIMHASPLLAVVKNEIYMVDYRRKKLLKYDNIKKLWVNLGFLPESALYCYGWSIAFRSCGDRLIVTCGPRHTLKSVEIHSWVPSEGPLRWELLARKDIGDFVYYCAVMSC